MSAPVVPLMLFKRGDRVRVVAENAPPCREGTVVEVFPGQGYRVHHDRPAWASGLFAGKQDFNWTPSEVEAAK